MISGQIHGLRTVLQLQQATGRPPSTELIKVIINRLGVVHEDAKQLEAMRIPDAQRVTRADLASGKVVLLRPTKNTKEAPCHGPTNNAS